MPWFEEQLRTRRIADDAAMTDALDSMAAAVIGRRLRDALDSRALVHSAVEEILKYYHLKPNQDEVPEGLETLEEQLDFQMRPFGIMFRAVKLEEGWYRDASGVMLGTLREDGSAVALIPGKISGYSWMDLRTGKRVKLNRKTDQLLDREAVCFYEPLPRRALKIRDLLLFMMRQLSVSDIVMYIGMMAAVTALGLLTPMFSRWLFGEVLASGSMRVLIALASFMVCYSVSSALFGAFRSLVSTRIATKQDMAVEAAVMNRLMSLPPSFFRQYSSGELNRRAAYVQSLCNTLFNTIGTTGLTSVFSLIYIAQVFSFAPALVAPSLAITLATVVISLITTFRQMSITREQMELSATTDGMTYSMLTGIQKIKLAGAEKRMFSRWAKAYSKQAELTYNPPTWLKLSGTLSLAVTLIGSLVLYALAVKSGVSLADYLAFNSAYGLVEGAFTSFAHIAVVIAGIRPTLEMAKPIMEAEPELSENRENVRSLRGGIELSHVSFRYDENMNNVIDDLSLKIRAGEYLAIVGSTGCGKSTLLRLMLGFEKPQKGSIFYDRYDLNRVDLQSLRRKIGVVMQDSGLFQGDIFSNIVISAPQLGMKEAWEAAEIAAVAEDIRQMPMGMSTIISEGQGGISGGQRQRLMIARAVAPGPKILMFDEATSALDNVTQKKVSDAIDGLKCTRVVIAHRLSTIRHADRIVVLQQGKIAEEGTYEELIEKNGFFADLVKRQRLDVDAD